MLSSFASAPSNLALARLPLFLLMATSALLAPLACGGDVEVGDPSGAGGSSSSAGNGGATTGATGSTATASGVSSGSTGGAGGGSGNCKDLGATYFAALEEARKCNACKNFDGCINGEIFEDVCGCPVGTDSSNTDAVAKTKAAHEAWIAGGCGPSECGQPCATGMGWSCAPGAAGTCEGVCSPF